MENVFQRHQPCAGAQRQPGPVQVVQLHRHRTGTQRDHVAKGAAPAHIQPLPQGELRQTAAHDDPRHAPLQQGVAEADRQHRQHLPHRKLRQRRSDLGPVILKSEHDDAGKCQQHQQRDHGLFAGGLLHGGLAHGNKTPFTTGNSGTSIAHLPPPFVNGSGTLLGNLRNLIKWGDLSREKAMPGSVQLSGIVFS